MPDYVQGKETYCGVNKKEVKKKTESFTAFDTRPEHTETKRGKMQTCGKVTQFLLILEEAVKISLLPFNGLKILVAYSTLRPAASCTQLEQNQ